MILISLFILTYILILCFLYLFQERFIFFPEKLDKAHQFHFEQDFEEINIQTDDGIALHGLLFKTEKPQGLVFYLHGNAGSIRTWGEDAKLYIDLNYDVFFLDYRGYGKSDGSINNQEQIFQDVQATYDFLKRKYPESQIIVLGYSIGTGPAAKVAATNKPKSLILQAPFYSLVDLIRKNYPFIPSIIIKYPFRTNEFLQQCKMPVFIFHGTRDEIIYYESSVNLKKQSNQKVTLITLKEHGHNGMSENPSYQRMLMKILN